MYYEQLQALGAHYGLQKRAGLGKKAALSPEKVLPVLRKFMDLKSNVFLSKSIAPRVNPVNGKFKHGLTMDDIAKPLNSPYVSGDATGYRLGTIGTDILEKQYPYLAKLDKGRRALSNMLNGDPKYMYLHSGDLADVANTNSKTLLKSLTTRPGEWLAPTV